MSQRPHFVWESSFYVSPLKLLMCRSNTCLWNWSLCSCCCSSSWGSYWKSKFATLLVTIWNCWIFIKKFIIIYNDIILSNIGQGGTSWWVFGSFHGQYSAICIMPSLFVIYGGFLALRHRPLSAIYNLGHYKCKLSMSSCNNEFSLYIICWKILLLGDFL